ncbi:hypothetical protein ACH47B_26200 [Rhodococcus sp. NPDC019627]|uniref:hypothetical protein n=1 Tax=unclassified Rhodococcus (in: high G+C Gram-positive bacteria) TaxID=192944 RepID=UPI0033DC6FDC
MSDTEWASISSAYIRMAAAALRRANSSRRRSVLRSYVSVGKRLLLHLFPANLTDQGAAILFLSRPLCLRLGDLKCVDQGGQLLFERGSVGISQTQDRLLLPPASTSCSPMPSTGRTGSPAPAARATKNTMYARVLVTLGSPMSVAEFQQWSYPACHA